MTPQGTFLDAVRRARVFVFPSDCAGCSRPDERVCPSCCAALDATPQRVRFGADDSARERGEMLIVSAGEYEAPFTHVLHALKEEGRTGLARDLAPRLRATLDAFARWTDPATEHDIHLVAPPSSRENRRARGFEPLEIIARRAGITLSRPLVSARRREDQASLRVAARAENMRHSMRVRGDVAGASIVLIDDLMTTGATLTEMARALHEAGASVLGAVVLAHAVRRWPGRDTRVCESGQNS